MLSDLQFLGDKGSNPGFADVSCPASHDPSLIAMLQTNTNAQLKGVAWRDTIQWPAHSWYQNVAGSAPLSDLPLARCPLARALDSVAIGNQSGGNEVLAHNCGFDCKG